MEDLFNIAIIGRELNNNKWLILYEILNDNSDDGIRYEKFEISNPKWENNFNKDNFDAYIYLATKEKYIDKPYIKLASSASEDNIRLAMLELADKISEVNQNEDDNIDDIDIVVRHNSIIDNGGDNSDINVYSESYRNNNVDSDSFIVDKLLGVSVQVNNKVITLSFEDAIKFKELLELIKESGFEIVDVITE